MFEIWECWEPMDSGEEEVQGAEHSSTEEEVGGVENSSTVSPVERAEHSSTASPLRDARFNESTAVQQPSSRSTHAPAADVSSSDLDAECELFASSYSSHSFNAPSGELHASTPHAARVTPYSSPSSQSSAATSDSELEMQLQIAYGQETQTHTHTPPPPSNDPPLAATKRQLLQSAFQGMKTVFQFLGLEGQEHMHMTLYGVDERYFGLVALCAQGPEQCIHCLEKRESCMCWSDRPAKGEQALRAMAQEALAFSEALIPPTEYREELETCAEYGVCAYLVRFAMERSTWLGRYREVYKNYHGLLQRRIEIKRSVTERMMDVGIKRSYNKMWEKLADQKMDILAFFNADSQETCEEMWSARQGELVTIMRERRKHMKLPWQTEYFFTDGYLDAQLENRAMVDFVYQEARDVQRRRDPPKGACDVGNVCADAVWYIL